MSLHWQIPDGGYLIYGVKEGDDDETKGFPVEVCGFAPPDGVEQHIGKMENLIRDGVERPLHGYRIKPVPTDSGQPALVMYVPSSWSKPHWVSLYGHRKFYIRHETVSSPLDFGGLQQLFTLSETAAERIRDFRAERIGRILSGETPVILETGPKLVLHVVPFSAGSTMEQYDLSILPNPLVNSLINNSEGLIEEGIHSYHQVFRDGSIEYVQSYFPEANDRRIPITDLEVGVRHYFLPKAFKWQRLLSVSPPCFIMLSLLNIRGFTMTLYSEQIQQAVIATRYLPRTERNRPFNKDHHFVTEEKTETLEPDIDALMRPAFDRVWHAFRYPRSLNYDENGTWIGPNQ